MGFADVVRSTRPGVAAGTRCCGFYPMARHLVIQPGAVSPAQIIDAAPHRAGLAPVHAQSLLTTGDAVCAAAGEDRRHTLVGRAGAARIGAARARLCDASDAWLRVVRSRGAAALEHSWADAVAGRANPDILPL